MHGHVHTLGVLGAQLEDVAYLYAVFQPQLAAAHGAGIAGAHLGDVGKRHAGKVALNVKALVVIPFLVRARYHARCALQGEVVYLYYLIRKSYGSYVSAGDLLRYAAVVGHDVHLYRLFQLGFVHFQIAAHERDDYLASVAAHRVYDRLHRAGGVCFEQSAHLVYRGGGAGIHELELFINFGERIAPAFRHFHIRAVVAAAAEHEGVFARGRYQHELVRHAAAHHARIRLEVGEVFKTYALEYPVIGVVRALIISVQIFLACVEGVCVLHGEFAHADKSAAAARFVAKLGLNLIDHAGQLVIGRHDVARHMHGGFFVRHAEQHVVTRAVLKAHHLLPDGSISARFLPHFAGHYHGEEHFLPVDGVHLLTDDVLNF